MVRRVGRISTVPSKRVETEVDRSEKNLNKKKLIVMFKLFSLIMNLTSLFLKRERAQDNPDEAPLVKRSRINEVESLPHLSLILLS